MRFPRGNAILIKRGAFLWDLTTEFKEHFPFSVAKEIKRLALHKSPGLGTKCLLSQCLLSACAIIYLGSVSLENKRNIGETKQIVAVNHSAVCCFNNFMETHRAH